jgi:hypothetical protein
MLVPSDPTAPGSRSRWPLEPWRTDGKLYVAAHVQQHENWS